MWFKRLLALGALAAVAVVIAIVARDTSPVEPQAKVTRTPTPTANAKERAASATPPKVAAVSGTAARRMPVPILMYHVISKAPAGVPNAELWVDQRVFADQMRALRAAKYTGITLEQAWDGWKHGGPMPRKPIVITFDDGYLSHYTHAKPVLRALGWPGVLNLEVNAIGPGGLSTKQIRTMLDAGWEVDSHTLTHPDLTTLDDAALRHELVDSRRQLRKRFGVPVDFFAYPAGKYDDRVKAATEAAGYKAATTVDEGIARGRDDPFALKRVRVNGSDTADSLMAKLDG